MNGAGEHGGNDMTDRKQDIRRLAVYLAVTYAVTYAAEFILLHTCDPIYYQFILMGVMFVPTLGTLAACRGLTKKRAGINWKFDIKKKFGWLALAWFSPIIFTAVGAVMYFLMFPGDFSTKFEFLKETFEAQGIEVKDGAVNGMPIEILAIVSIVQCFTLAPAFNALLALGEEIGWRGFMTPAFVRLLGRKGGLVVSGVLWGLWHAPLIVLIGYEYGTEYTGFPWLGILFFCFVCIALAICHTYLYERSGSIIVASVLHGSFNAAATLPQLFLKDADYKSLLGPFPTGLISLIPIAAAAAVILFVSKPLPEETPEEPEQEKVTEPAE